MRRLVITAADSTFGTTLLTVLSERGLSEFEWIIGTVYDARDQLEEAAENYPELKEKLILKQVNMKSIPELEDFCAELSGREAATDFVHLPAPKAVPLQFKKLEWDAFRDHLEISFRSAVLILKTILPAMAKNKEGRVLLMSSYYATEEGTANFLAPYISAKSAMLGLMRSLAKEYEGKNLKINAIAPDLSDTKYLEEMPELMKETAARNSSRGRMLSAREVAEAMLPYLAEDTKENGRTVVIK